jgi:hypothetical protein
MAYFESMKFIMAWIQLTQKETSSDHGKMMKLSTKKEK